MEPERRSTIMGTGPFRLGLQTPILLVGAVVVVAVALVALGVMVLTQHQGATGNTTQEAGNASVCPTLYEPVCGSDNNTYANRCIATAAGASIAYNGTCAIEYNCTDSDLGREPELAGWTAKGAQNLSDSCSNGTSVMEYYCDDNSIISEAIACGKGYECEGGKCVKEKSPLCTDSDEGLDKLVAGTVYYGAMEYNDSCGMIDQVKEYYCQNGSPANTLIECGTGYQCMGGACAEMQSVCSESDAGKDIFNYGTIEVHKGYDLIGQQFDSCKDAHILREFFCQDNAVASDLIDCGMDNICTEGECVPLSCTDTDGGQNLMAAGAVSKGTESYSDSCDSNNNVREYYCSGGAIQYAVSTCPTGYTCKGGACEQEPSCTDSDGGRDYTHYGYVTKAGETYPDACSNGLLIENYCSGNTVLTEAVGCPAGTSCYQGYCKAN